MNGKGNDILGLVSGALTTFAFVPQVISIWRMKPVPATAISLPMYIIFNIGVAGWLAYGARKRLLPVAITNGITLIFSLSILVYKLLYG